MMTKEQKQQAFIDTVNTLREVFPEGSTVNLVLVRKSEGAEHFMVAHSPSSSDKIYNITKSVAHAINSTPTKAGFISISGWGINRAYELVTRLSRALYNNEYKLIMNLINDL